jgi:hypothetical protein
MQPRWSECERSLADELAVDLPNLWAAIAELCAEHLVRLGPGVCSMCQHRLDVLLTMVFGA